MTDSTRRSGRATKGQHSKNLELEEPTQTTKKGAKGKKKNEPTPEEEEPPAKIRCICGVVEEDEDDDRKMICCEECDVWQHNECMEVSENDKELPEEYYCEQCRPQDHKALLAKIARGEKPWEGRAKQREIEEEEKKSRKKGKKGGKRGRPSTSKKDEVATNGAENEENEVSHIDEAVEEPPAPPPPQTPVVENNNNKRKQPDQSPADKKALAQIEPPSKSRKVSSPPPKTPLSASNRRKSSGVLPAKAEPELMSLQTELVENVDDLRSDDRKRVVTALGKMLVEETKKAEKAGSFSLPGDQKVEEFGIKLALSVEFAIYLNYWGTSSKPSDQYSDKFRAINHNLKANPLLRDRVLQGALSPNDLSKMSTHDMASKELQDKKAEMLKEAEKQHTLIQEEGPRIRRTHKGEELVDDQSHVADATHTAFAAPIRKRPSEIDTTMTDASPEPISAISTAGVELPADVPIGSPEGHQSVPVERGVSPQSSPAPDRASAARFDINDVLSQIKSPDAEAQRSRSIAQPLDAPVSATPQQADADIDQLLKDEEPEDEEPYSPKDDLPDIPPGYIWQGSLGMPGVATFQGKGKYCAGADLSATLPWNELISDSLRIQGRIDVERASSYLCGLKWSTTSDLVVVAVTPDGDENDITQFNRLFRYFTDRNRWGVISTGADTNTPVRDIYLIPLEDGSAAKPEFVALLDTCNLEDKRAERVLLISFVVKQNNSPSAQPTPRPLESASIASPIGSASNAGIPMSNYPSSNFQNTSQVSPYPPSAYPQYNGTSLPGQSMYNAPQASPLQPSYPPAGQQKPPPLVGIDAARYVMGDMVNAEAVQALLTEAPQSTVPEFSVVKTLLDQNPTLRNDYVALKETMTKQYQSR